MYMSVAKFLVRMKLTGISFEMPELGAWAAEAKATNNREKELETEHYVGCKGGISTGDMIGGN